jgi:ElaB/YqjD/DUF883 family membrane-anchored ribosome-binding protein
MRGILDDLANLPKTLTAKAKKDFAPFQAASNFATNVDAASQKYEKKIEDAATTAEVYLAASLGFQALASAAAIGIMIYSIKNYNRGTRRSKGGKR